MRSAAGLGDRPSLSSSACSHVFPSSGLTIKYQLHFRLIQIWGTQNLAAQFTFEVFVGEFMQYKSHCSVQDRSRGIVSYLDQLVDKTG